MLTRGRRPPDRARCVVVGGGLAGLELAKELTVRGVEVVVLEAGPDHDVDHVHTRYDHDRATDICFDAVTEDEYFHRPWTSVSAPHYTANSGLRRRLGGRSLYWHGVSLPIEEWALCEPWWPRAVVEDLTTTWRDGPPLYRRVAEQLGLARVGLPADGEPGPDTATLGEMTLHRTPWARVREAATGRWRAYSPVAHCLDRPPEDHGQVVCDVDVTAVELGGGAVTGVCWRRTGTGEAGRISAEAVVLAAGTVENNRLAIQALTEGGRLAEPVLTGLNDHIVQGFLVRVPDRARRVAARMDGSFVSRGDAHSRSYLRIETTSDPSGTAVDVRMTGEQLPHDGSFVRCRPSSGYPWATDVSSGLTDADREVVARQRETLATFWSVLAGELDVPGSELGFGDFDRPDRDNSAVLSRYGRAAPDGVPRTWTSLLGTEDHEGGGVAFGTVLDDDHEAYGVPGLFAAGPSTFPRAGSANPSLTSLALAHRLAAILADRYG